MKKLDQPEQKQVELKNSYSVSLKVMFVEWITQSTTHGLPNIFRTSNISLKIIWLCCLLACGCYFIYSAVKTSKEFMGYPTVITTKIVKDLPGNFPAVTICNLKAVNKTTQRSYNITLAQMNLTELIESENPVAIISAAKMINRAFINYYFNDTLRPYMGYSLNDMLISCLFNYQSCTANDFYYHYDPLYGNCYTFNKGIWANGTTHQIKKLSIAGKLHGLILELFVGNPAIETEDEYNDGIVISIHNQSSAPFRAGEDLMAATNAETDLIISRTFTSRLGSPFGDCYKDTSEQSKFSSYYFDYIVRTLKYSYSQKYCNGLCLQDKILKSCNCSNAFMPVFDSPSYCVYDPQIYCMVMIIDTFGEESTSDECSKACPFECDTIDYTTHSYQSYYPNDYYKKFLAKNAKIIHSNVSFHDISRSVLRVNIYYKAMEYTLVTEEEKTSVETLFSNIGGTLGLCLGMSLLSFVETVDLIFIFVRTFIGYKKNKKQIATQVVLEYL